MTISPPMCSYLNVCKCVRVSGSLIWKCLGGQIPPPPPPSICKSGEIPDLVDLWEIFILTDLALSVPAVLFNWSFCSFFWQNPPRVRIKDGDPKLKPAPFLHLLFITSRVKTGWIQLLLWRTHLCFERQIPKSSITRASVHLNSSEMCPDCANFQF